jgi:hypothetical protein
MAKFLFQPDPIDKVNFKPIAIDLHKEVIKIVNSQSYADFQLNNTESVIFGTDKEEILSRIQRELESISSISMASWRKRTSAL